MTKQNNKRLMPKLRFPEFRDEPGWDVHRLGDIAIVIAGQSPKGSYFNEVGIGTPFYQGISNFSDVYIGSPSKWTTQVTKLAKSGDILMSVRAPVGAVNISNDTICIGRGLAGIRPTIDKWYLFYLLTKLRPSIIGNGGSIFDSISKDQIKNIQVHVPDHSEEQQKIAECLNSLDDLISAENRKLEALRTYKKGLMQHLFPRPGETYPRLRFPEFQSEKSWKTYKFGRFVIESFYGTSKSTSDHGRYPVIRMGNMTGGTLELSNLTYIDLDLDEYNKLQLQKGDILLNRTNSQDLVGKIALFDHKIDCITASYIVTYRINQKELDPYFCNLLLNTYIYQTMIKDLSTPSISQANINPTSFKNGLYICLPSIEEQRHIVRLVRPLMDSIASQSRILESLQTHKKGMMQTLFPSPETARDRIPKKVPNK